MNSEKNAFDYLELAKENKRSFQEATRNYNIEANQSDRHLSNQLTTIAGILISIGTFSFSLVKNQAEKSVIILLFLALLFIAISLFFGIIYSFQCTSLFEKASNLNSECEEVWSNLEKISKEQVYVSKKLESDKIMDKLVTKTNQEMLYCQIVFLILGLLFSFISIFLFMFC